MERRSFLASLALLGVDLTALAPTSSAQAGSTGERTLTVDGALLRALGLTTAAYERMRHRVPGRHLMRQVVGHIELTQDVLRGSLRCHGFWRRTPKPTRPSASWTRA